MGSGPTPATFIIKELHDRNSFFVSIGELLVSWTGLQKERAEKVMEDAEYWRYYRHNNPNTSDRLMREYKQIRIR